MPICFLFSGYSKKTYELPLSDNDNDVEIGRNQSSAG
jgi:hypothetical protein